MPYDAAATRARIMEAATAEFAERGIDGARVDRIASRAGANKASIYSYFGGKDQLFAAVLQRQLGELMEALTLHPERVPEYAGELFDHYRAHPELLRLLLNEAQHHGDGPVPHEPMRRAHYRDKARAIAAARDAGRVRGDLSPQQLLMLMLGTVAWYFAVPQMARMLLRDESAEPDEEKAAAAYREAVIDAVRRLVAPAPGA